MWVGRRGRGWRGAGWLGVCCSGMERQESIGECWRGDERRVQDGNGRDWQERRDECCIGEHGIVGERQDCDGKLRPVKACKGA